VRRDRHNWRERWSDECRRSRWHYGPPWTKDKEELRRAIRPALQLRFKIFLNFGLAIAIAIAITHLLMHQGLHPGPRVFIAVGIALWAASGAVAHHIALPLWELMLAMKDLGTGKLDRRVQLPRHATREISVLAEKFNVMAGRIEALVQGQRELMSTVSHELRTPLARMRVLLALLQESSPENALIAKFEREIVEMDALVGELLAEARISAGAISRCELDVADIVQECAERLGITLVGEVPSATLHGDPTLVSRAITLLLDNAQKHGGRCIHVRVEPDGEDVRVVVEDDGPGFDPADIPKLFEAFARGRGAVADERRGVGFGLYLVRRIAEAHGGKVFAENRPSGGARVGWSLPVNTAS
jgi:two-component system OmpR family sensor kinase